MKIMKFFVSAMLFATLLLSSCGGDGSTKTPKPPTPTASKTYVCVKIGGVYVPTHGGICQGSIEVMP